MTNKADVLAEALAPFAEWAKKYPTTVADDQMVLGRWGGVGPFAVVGTFRRAAKALAAYQAAQSEGEGAGDYAQLVADLRSDQHRQPIDPKAIYRTRDVKLFEDAARAILELLAAAPIPPAQPPASQDQVLLPKLAEGWTYMAVPESEANWGYGEPSPPDTAQGK